MSINQESSQSSTPESEQPGISTAEMDRIWSEAEQSFQTEAPAIMRRIVRSREIRNNQELRPA